MKTLALACSLCSLVLLFALPLLADEILPSDIERRLVREPKYQSTPRYAVLIVGTESKAPVWIVHDGQRLYIDKNGNRNLTDDGAPLVPPQKRSLDNNRWDQRYVLDAWKQADGSLVRDFQLRHWNYADPEDQYGLSLTVNDRVPMYAGWNALLATSAKAAPVIHFGGPLVPKMLRYKEFVLGTKPERFSIAFTTPRESKLAAARLSIDALPPVEKPTAVINWPVAKGAAPLQTTHVLTERCCYWEFYTETFAIPSRAIPGQATVTILVDPDQFPLELLSDHFEVPVVRQK